MDSYDTSARGHNCKVSNSINAVAIGYLTNLAIQELENFKMHSTKQKGKYAS